MKRALGYLLAGLGGLLIVLAPVLKFYVVPSLAKAPLVPGEGDAGVSVTINEGTAAQLLDLARTLKEEKLTVREDVPVVSTRYTRGDAQAAQSGEAKDQGLAVYDSFSRLTDPDEDVLSAGTIRVAFDRITSELTTCCGANVDGQDATFSGINPLKFPFFVEKKAYEYFDTTLREAIPIDFVGEEDLFGLKVYRFEQDISPTEYDELELPGGLVGSDQGTVTGGRFYANSRTLWVDPVTGTIIKGSEHQRQTLRVDGEDKVTLVDATVSGQDDEVRKVVDDTKATSQMLDMLNSTIPLVSLILGILALVGAVLIGRLQDRVEEEQMIVGLDGDQWSQYQKQ